MTGHVMGYSLSCAGGGKGKKKKAESQLQTALLPTPLPPVQVSDKQPKFINKHQNLFYLAATT